MRKIEIKNQDIIIYTNMDSLPHELVSKIILYAHPRIDPKLKRSIEVTSAHRIVQNIYKKWGSSITMLNSYNWNAVLNDNIIYYDKEKILLHLKNCGCCERHSKNIYGNNIIHCENICGSHTLKQFHNKKTWGGKSCICWCRHMIRHIIN